MVLTFLVLFVTIALFIHGRLRSDLVALLSVLALFLGGIITTDQALAGFSDSTVILIAALFVVGEGLSRTGVTAWLGNLLIRTTAGSQTRLLVAVMLGAGLLSAFISNTGTVATLLPAVVSAVWRIGALPSMFLMPLAFATNTGGLLTLTGTPSNIVVADALTKAGLQPFGFFEFALIGLPLLLGTLLYMMTLGRRLLPRRESDDRPVDLGKSVGEVASTFGLEERLYSLRVRARSPLAGKTLAEAGIGRDYSVTVLRVDRNAAEDGAEPSADGDTPAAQWRRLRDRVGHRPAADDAPLPGPETVIYSQDRLLVKGRLEYIERLAMDQHLGFQAVRGDGEALSAELLSSEIGIAEVLLAVRSQYIGRTLAEVRFADKYRVQVLGIWRGDRQLVKTTEPLKFGDALLVRGRWDDIDLLANEPRNFVVVGSPDALSRQVVELTPRSVFAVVALAAMVIMMVTNVVPTVIAALLTAAAMVLAGCLNMNQAYRAVGWQSVVLIAAMIPMSTALQITGGAQLIADGLVATLGQYGPVALLAGVFLLTTAFSQVISNTATAVLVAPIVIEAAMTLGVSPYPMLMGVAVAASNAFLTPIATTTNLMVYTPGGYRFTDYFKVGAPLTLLFLILTLVLVPLIWPF